MKLRQLFRSFLLVLSLATAITVKAQGFSAASVTRLQQVLDSIQNSSANPVVGGITAVINVDGLAFWQGATGYAARNVDAQNNLLPGGTAMSSNMLFRGYSVTKTFTAALVLELVKEGALSLEDPIINYMPYMNLYNPALNGSVTVRQLLNHESGYSDWEEELQLQIAIAFDPTHQWSPYELMVFTTQLSPPGTVRRYSHNNYVFLGAIIEAATGRNIEELYRERFFTPLNLQSIYFDGRETHGSRPMLVAPHDNISPFNPIFQFTAQPTFPNSYTNISAFPYTGITSLGFAGGALISDAADLATFSNALFNGRITTPGILDSMINSVSPTPDEFSNKLGYGIKNTPHISGQYDFIGHNGSAPGYRSAMFYNPDRKMSIVVLTNYAGISPYDISKKLFEALPAFICGNENRREKKIIICSKGQTVCVDRNAAVSLIEKGSYLGSCDPSSFVSEMSPETIGTDKPLKPTAFTIYPNPTSGSVNFLLTVPATGKVQLSIYDLSGKLIKQAFSGSMNQGEVKTINCSLENMSSGIYLARLETPTEIRQEKFVITR